jgi:hypothetical protein
MALEHRWSRRQSVYMDALVFHRLTGLIRVDILNISLDGVFISGRHIKLPPLTCLELTFALTGGREMNILQTEAFVIHNSHNGYGLMFKDFRLSAFQELKDRLDAA